MISMIELNPKNAPLTPEQQKNIEILLFRINVVRDVWAESMTVTSGFRTLEDHKRIYTEKAKKAGLTTIRIPMGSQHLKGAAVDISDPNGNLMSWCKSNQEVLESAELWCEDGTVGWIHFQIVPPASGKRFFLP